MNLGKNWIHYRVFQFVPILFRYNSCFKAGCSTDCAAIGTQRDDLLHSSLLIFNELLRIANFEYEEARIQHSLDGPIVQSSSRFGSTIGQNPIKWLIENSCPATVESNTSRTLVTDCFFAEVFCANHYQNWNYTWRNIPTPYRPYNQHQEGCRSPYEKENLGKIHL